MKRVRDDGEKGEGGQGSNYNSANMRSRLLS